MCHESPGTYSENITSYLHTELTNIKKTRAQDKEWDLEQQGPPSVQEKESHSVERAFSPTCKSRLLLKGFSPMDTPDPNAWT